MKHRRKKQIVIWAQGAAILFVIVLVVVVRLIVRNVFYSNRAILLSSSRVSLQNNITALRIETKKVCPRVTTETRQGTAVILSKTVYDRSLLTIPDHKHALCAVEVGTADGRGTTLALMRSLDSWCRKTARSWRLFSYEGLSNKYGSAKKFLKDEEHVEIVNELVMTQNNLDNMVLPYIDAPTGQSFPGLEFYQGVYQKTTHMMKDGKIGRFLVTRPTCARNGVADFVSIDTTRYTFAAILQTLVDKKMVDMNTVFVMENDYWIKSDGTRDTALEMVSRFFGILDVQHYASGHDFPWVSFRIEQQHRHDTKIASNSVYKVITTSSPKYLVFTACWGDACERYKANINSMRCYVERHPDYEFMLEKLGGQKTHGCGFHPLYRRHCVLAHHLQNRGDITAALFVEADCVIFDFQRRFESFLLSGTHNYDVAMNIRFHNGEVYAGSYAIMNVAYARDFLVQWSLTQFTTNADNGALHQALLTKNKKSDACLPSDESKRFARCFLNTAGNFKYGDNCHSWKEYQTFMRCFHTKMSENHCRGEIFQHMRFLHPLEAMVYDGWLTQYRHSKGTFIQHAFKSPPIGGINDGYLLPDPWQTGCKIMAPQKYLIPESWERELLVHKNQDLITTREKDLGFQNMTCLVK